MLLLLLHCCSLGACLRAANPRQSKVYRCVYFRAVAVSRSQKRSE